MDLYKMDELLKSELKDNSIKWNKYIDDENKEW